MAIFTNYLNIFNSFSKFLAPRKSSLVATGVLNSDRLVILTIEFVLVPVMVLSNWVKALSNHVKYNSVYVDTVEALVYRPTYVNHHSGVESSAMNVNRMAISIHGADIVQVDVFNHAITTIYRGGKFDYGNAVQFILSQNNLPIISKIQNLFRMNMQQGIRTIFRNT